MIRIVDDENVDSITQLIHFLQDVKERDDVELSVYRDFMPTIKMSDGKIYGKLHMTVEVTFNELYVKDEEWKGWELWKKDS